MTFAFRADQIAKLDAPLDAARVAQREQSGRKFFYLEAWYVIAEANRIFGFDGWSRETVDLRAVAQAERKVGKELRDGWEVGYIAKVRITVGTIVREGTGTGSGIDASLIQAHESAAKEAESDAMKRALITFGFPFGLALYDKKQENVFDYAAVERYVDSAIAWMQKQTTAEAIHKGWNDELERFLSLPTPIQERLQAAHDEALRLLAAQPQQQQSTIVTGAPTPPPSAAKGDARVDAREAWTNGFIAWIGNQTKIADIESEWKKNGAQIIALPDSIKAALIRAKDTAKARIAADDAKARAAATGIRVPATKEELARKHADSGVVLDDDIPF